MKRISCIYVDNVGVPVPCGQQVGTQVPRNTNAHLRPRAADASRKGQVPPKGRVTHRNLKSPNIWCFFNPTDLNQKFLHEGSSPREQEGHTASSISSPGPRTVARRRCHRHSRGDTVACPCQRALSRPALAEVTVTAR